MSEGRRFQVVEQLGEGGFGVVYLARMLDEGEFSTLVALKVLNAEASQSPEVGGRLRDEARILGQLRHRAIVGVRGLMRWRGLWTVIMEYVPGADVNQLLAEGPLPPRAALEVVAEIAGALEAAYVRPGLDGQPLRLLHRDIKPQNIRITPDGDVKLLDFGIARADMDSRESLTRASVTFGTPDYMAPERMDFSLQERDVHVGDVYSLGIVLYEMLTATRFGRNSPAERRQRALLDDALAQLRSRLKLRDAALITPLLERMLAFHPHDRPSADVVKRRCRELGSQVSGDDLRTWAESTVPIVAQTLKGEQPSELLSFIEEDTRAEPPPRTSAVVSRPGRGRWLGLTLVSLLVVGLSGAGVWLGFRGAGSPSEPASLVEPAPPAGPEEEGPPSGPVEPSVEPQSAAEPTPPPVVRQREAKPAEPQGVEVMLKGDVKDVWLVSRSGERVNLPGRLSPGDYTLFARFEGSADVNFGPKEVPPGGGLTVRCSAASTLCR